LLRRGDGKPFFFNKSGDITGKLLRPPNYKVIDDVGSTGYAVGRYEEYTSGSWSVTDESLTIAKFDNPVSSTEAYWRVFLINGTIEVTYITDGGTVSFITNSVNLLYIKEDFALSNMNSKADVKNLSLESCGTIDVSSDTGASISSNLIGTSTSPFDQYASDSFDLTIYGVTAYVPDGAFQINSSISNNPRRQIDYDKGAGDILRMQPFSEIDQ